MAHCFVGDFLDGSSRNEFLKLRLGGKVLKKEDHLEALRP